MSGLKRDQIIEVARRWRYSFESGKKANLLSLRAEIEHVKAQDQRVTVKYAEALYDLLINCRPHKLAADAAAYLSDVSEADIASGTFPPFNKEDVQARANRSREQQPRAEVTAVDEQPSLSPTSSKRPKADFSHLPSGHQTLLGAANVVGNGLSIAFFGFIVLLVLGGIIAILGG